MGTKTHFAVFASLLFLIALSAPVAEAQRGRGAPDLGRAIRNAGKVPDLRGLGNLSGGGRNHSSPFPVLDALSRIDKGHGGGSSPFPILEALSQLDKGHNNKHHNSSNPLDLLYGLSQLGGYGPGYGGQSGYGGYPNPDAYYGYKGDKEYADAMRDAAIAGAVGNVVSAIVSSQSVRTPVPVYAQPAPVYTQPAPAYVQPAPAPAYVQPSPLGHYETRRETVGGGYYQREQLWVPESTDPQTGNIIEGHYATVKRWVPEVIQETRVWVAP